MLKTFYSQGTKGDSINVDALELSIFLDTNEGTFGEQLNINDA